MHYSIRVLVVYFGFYFGMSDFGVNCVQREFSLWLLVCAAETRRSRLRSKLYTYQSLNGKN